MAADAHIVPLNTVTITPTRALLSVSDKSGLEAMARGLHAAGVELVSTGGTRKAIESMGLPVTDVSEVTGFPEIMDGRVKTLHPGVHAGILARTSYETDVLTLDRLGIRPFDVVVVNLYPFAGVAADPATTPETALEFIDIGGPTMVRACAKNFPHACIVTSPGQYDSFLLELASGGITYETRRRLAADAFAHTSAYDTAISMWFSRWLDEPTPRTFGISLPRFDEARYGENPHQNAAVYGYPDRYFDCLHGKALSYNNYLDVTAALNLIAEFADAGPTCAIIKHTNPCGVASAPTLAEAYERAFQTDTVSPFGGIIAVNGTLDLPTAVAIDAIFTEIILAPAYTDEALDLLKRKSQRRLIRIERWPDMTGVWQVSNIPGGLLVQEPDMGRIGPADIRTVTRRGAGTAELADLLFAWKVAKHAKSNCIVFAKDGRTLGIGVGQTSRVDSSELAVLKAAKAGLSLQGAAVASEAFFPFPDGIEAAARAGCTSVIQPGGSVRDEDVIATADRLGLAMVFTGMRHFKH
jgi:phosphoribosylaminoimidazolecarboxamide formyltransferase/IMP cyclohydrolase